VEWFLIVHFRVTAQNIIHRVLELIPLLVASFPFIPGVALITAVFNLSFCVTVGLFYNKIHLIIIGIP